MKTPAARLASLDAHQAYCFNFWLLARRCAVGHWATGIAWALSVLAMTLTAGSVWLLVAVFSSPSTVNFRQLGWYEFFLAMVLTILNYQRFFRLLGDCDTRKAARLESVNGRPARISVAVVCLLGPISAIALTWSRAI